MPTALLFLLASLLAPSLAVASEAQHLAVGHGVMVHPGADTGDTPPAYDDPAWTATDWRKLKFRAAVWVRTTVEVPPGLTDGGHPMRSEEHTSELQSLMRISYAEFCLKKNKITTHKQAT